MSNSVYDAANRLTSSSASSLTHDLNGNLTSDGSTTYTWDARDRVSSLTGPGVTASFAYDGEGRRISKTVNAVTTDFLYDLANPVQELEGGIPKANMLTGLEMDEYLSRESAGSISSYLTDVLGSTLALASSAGLLEVTYTYEPFGSQLASGAATSNPFGFTGRENDGTGLVYNRNRYYSPALQRFVSEDPIGFRGGLNLYEYAGNNPITYVDLCGTEKKKRCQNLAEEVAWEYAKCVGAATFLTGLVIEGLIFSGCAFTGGGALACIAAIHEAIWPWAISRVGYVGTLCTTYAYWKFKRAGCD